MENKFTLNIPTTESTLEQAQSRCAVKEGRKEAISASSAAQVQAFLEMDMDDAAQRTAAVKTVENFGADAVSASSTKNAFLAKRIAAFRSNSDETGAVASGLAELSVQMKRLDPTAVNFSKVGGWWNPVRRYFTRYEKADSVIEGIIRAITNGERQLRNDNQTLLLEQEALEKETVKLKEYIALGQAFDASLSALIEKARADGEDERKISFLETEVLFPLRQKLMDMGTLVTVNYQGIGTMEIIRKNNLELMRGVERAKQVSVCALRVGVMCAQALYNQKLVLKAVQTLNESTAAIIAANAEMLGAQSDEIATLAANPMIAMDTLKQSFETVFRVMDTCEDYKKKALPQMAQAIETFASLAAEGGERMERLQQARDAS